MARQGEEHVVEGSAVNGRHPATNNIGAVGRARQQGAQNLARICPVLTPIV